MKASQYVSFEISFDAVVEASSEKVDYGVSGSPRFNEYTPDDWASNIVNIAGINVDVNDLPEELQDALWDIAMRQIDYNQWEEYE